MKWSSEGKIAEDVDPFAIHQHGKLSHPQRHRQDQQQQVAAIVNVFRQGLL
jgi:hypothetical protein